MEFTNDLLIKELQRYDLKSKVKIMNENEVELDIEFVGYYDETVYIKGYIL